MHVLTRMTRRPEEVAGERAHAQAMIDDFGPSSPYLVKRNRAILATLDWVAGAAAVAPATGVVRAADDDGIVMERIAAGDMEEAALRSRDEDTALRAGVVAETLAWFLRDPTAESPS